jgi:hypothetical protein
VVAANSQDKTAQVNRPIGRTLGAFLPPAGADGTTDAMPAGQTMGEAAHADQ